MLVMCDSVGSELGIKYNPSKSKCIKIGPLHNIQPSTLLLGSTELPWVQEFEYLGICLKSTKSFQVDLSNIRRKFFTSVNSILSKCSQTSDLVKLFLLESHCLPILLYAAESLHLPTSQLNEINSWWNSVYRKIFNYHKWESVRLLIFMLSRLNLLHIINLKTLCFFIKMNNCVTPVNATKQYFENFYKFSSECSSLFFKYNCYYMLLYGVWNIS